MKTEAEDRSVQYAKTGMDNLFAGSSSEDLAKAHFKGWNWTAGKPEPDVGGDLVVEIPAEANVQGAVFAAQIKSGQKWKSKERIKRSSALRLKGSPLPAFLFFVNRTTGEIRWVNLELLFDTDASFCAGGDLVVPLSALQAFMVHCKEPPFGFVDAVYQAKRRGAMKAAGSLSILAHAMHDHYKTIDPSLVVWPSFDGRRDVLAIAARSEPVSMTIEIRKPTEASKIAFRDSIEWGRPARVDALEFLLSGSPLWDHLSKEKRLTHFEFRPKPAWEGRGILATHADDGRRHTEVVDVQLTRGTLGGELVLVLCGGLLTACVRLDGTTASRATISIDRAVMKGWTMMELPTAGRALKILDGLLGGNVVELQLTDLDQEGSGPIELCSGPGSAEEFDELTFSLRAAIALTQLVTSQCWEVEGFPLAKATHSDMEMWLAGQQLLNDGRTALPAFSFFADFCERPVIGESEPIFGNILVNFALDIPLGGELLGRLPAWVYFRNYHAVLESTGVSDAWRVRCSPGEGATREYLAPSDELPALE